MQWIMSNEELDLLRIMSYSAARNITSPGHWIMLDTAGINNTSIQLWFSCVSYFIHIILLILCILGLRSPQAAVPGSEVLLESLHLTLIQYAPIVQTYTSISFSIFQDCPHAELEDLLRSYPLLSILDLDPVCTHCSDKYNPSFFLCFRTPLTQS